VVILAVPRYRGSNLAQNSTFKSAINRWKQQYRDGRLQQLAGTSSGKRIATTDKLRPINLALKEFYIKNEYPSILLAAVIALAVAFRS
jgi:hypothetical protein